MDGSGPRPLPLFSIAIKAGDETGRRNVERVAESKQHGNRWRILIVFEVADVRVVETSLERQFLLRQAGTIARPA